MLSFGALGQLALGQQAPSSVHFFVVEDLVLPLPEFTYGPVDSNAQADDPSVGNRAWLNPENSQFEDGIVSTTNSVSPTFSSHYLKVSDFGFAIPPDAVITGIQVGIKRNANDTFAYRDQTVSLIKGGTVQGDNKANLIDFWPTGFLTYEYYGSSTDKWGLDWTPADISAADFGAVLQVNDPLDNEGGTARVDVIQITVYYLPLSFAVLDTPALNSTHQNIVADDLVIGSPTLDTTQVEAVVSLTIGPLGIDEPVLQYVHRTGPDLPRGPLPNAIGQFVIGQSPIGTQPPFDVWDTIISQYANSPIITRLILNMFSYLDQTHNLDDFFDLIFNVDTAVGYGLDVWGRIVGITRTIHVPAGKWFGFDEMGTQDADPFGQSQFFSGHFLTQNFYLSDNAYRNLILIKAAANITNGSIPAINAMLMTLFPHRGNAYVTEGEKFEFFGFAEQTNTFGFNQAQFYDGSALPLMRMTYTFEFPLTPVERAIVATSGVLPKPTGVKASVVQIF